MRAFIGNLCIISFIVIFAMLFIETAQEYNSLQSINDVLDEKVDLTYQLTQNSFILDRNGKIISDIYGGENRVLLSFEDIPNVVIDALLSAEDQSFFNHQGFDVKGITRALIVNVKSESVEQGGSTVTQQLVRNLYLNHDQTYERKLSEILYAYQLERKLSKEKIIELYINTIYFQNGVYGMEAASRFYFNKSSSKLSVAEAAFLSAIPNNPELFNPLKNIDNTHTRKEWILSKMYEEQRIDEESYLSALDETIELNISKKIDQFPDYVTYIFSELEQLVGHQDGFFDSIAGATTESEKDRLKEQLKKKVQGLLSSGIMIETAFQPETQTHATQTINQSLGANNLQAATAIIDHRQNEIVAITGGMNYKKFDFHRGYQAFRQPGSSIKPLLVFAPYLEETSSNELTTVDASPFSKNGYQPRNFGGAVYGKTTMEQAFKHSYNTAAVRLLDRMTPEVAFSYLKKFHLEKLVKEDESLPAALGGLTHGVSVLEMTKAYTTFSTDGSYFNPKGIRRVTDLQGNTLYEWINTEEKLWSETTNREVRKMMAKVVAEGTGRQANFPTSSYVGGKTGTTNDTHDLWFIGATDRYTIGIWLGMDQPQPITVSDQQLHLRLWRSIASKLEN